MGVALEQTVKMMIKLIGGKFKEQDAIPRRVVSYKDVCLGINGGESSGEDDVPLEGFNSEFDESILWSDEEKAGLGPVRSSTTSSAL